MIFNPMETTKKHVLEINLISAQGLKSPSNNLRRMKTYALAWVDPSTKLRTRVDRVGGENPTWNDKFLFRVTPEFLASETSGISVEIYAVGYLRDTLIGTVRFLTSNLLPSPAAASSSTMTPFFTAFQIRRPSGRFHGVLNVGAMVIDGSDFAAAMNDVSAIGYHDLMGGSAHRWWRRHGDMNRSKSMDDHVGYENSRVCDGESGDVSDGGESTTSSSSTASTAFKDWNGMRDLAGNNHLRSSSDGGGMMSCLIKQRKHRFSPSDETLKETDAPQENKV